MLLCGAGSVHDATAENETRTLSFHHTHSDEDLTVTFKRDGRYDEAALKQLNHYLRDWRTQDETVMDRHLFDILWEVYRDVDGKQPIQIVSSYRSPDTNAMLRRRSSGVARYSQHMLGHAMDLYIPGVPLEQIRFAGLRLQRGGVGFYPTSGSPFVHLDTGSIRHWPRMTHDQLAKVFPDGRTVHVPTDGVPLKGYELAQADIEKRGDGDDAATIGKPRSWPRCSRARASRTTTRTMTRAAVDREARCRPWSSQRAEACRTVRAARKAASSRPPCSSPRPTSRPCSRRRRSRRTPISRAEAGNADRHHQCPRFLGRWRRRAEEATSAQVIAAVAARKALEAADPQSTASTSAPYQAMAYAPPAASPTDRANIVAASAPVPRSARPAALRNPNAATEINTVAVKGAAAPGERGRDRHAGLGRQGQRHLAPHRDAGAERAPPRCR